jgi:hypothetical protein
MPYIGRTPQVGNYQKCDALNASATADYTLQVNSTNVVPESLNHMIVSLNGVIQEPGATGGFTVSGSTLSFTSALTSNDTIDFVMLLGNVLDIGTPSDGTISNAKLGTDVISGETDIGGALADADLVLVDDGAGGTLRKSAMSRIKTYVGGGITEADEWRVTSNFSGDAAPIASNWERNDTEFDKIGTGMTESSGVFTFPSTGIWLITAQATFSNNTGNCHYNGLIIRNTVNNGGAWNGRSSGEGSVARPTSNNYYTQVAVKVIFDVTDTSNYKSSLQVYHQESNSITYGSSTSQATGVTFIRLGDT